MSKSEVNKELIVNESAENSNENIPEQKQTSQSDLKDGEFQKVTDYTHPNPNIPTDHTTPTHLPDVK